MARRSTRDEFIQKAIVVWGDRWDYTNVAYHNKNSKVHIVCPLHGGFQQTPRQHLRGKVGCSFCLGKRTTSQFIAEAMEVWGARWDYSDTLYISTNDPVTIVCPRHGPFTQRAHSHLQGMVGCLNCSGIVLSTETYIEKARDLWGDRWDYSNTIYSGALEEITITCRTHGPFKTTANYHLQGSINCSSCNHMNTTTYVSKAKEVWGDRWDYSKTELQNYTAKITITCPDHGDFTQLPYNHLKGNIGCPQCRPTRRLSQQEFIAKAQDRWDGRWDYAKSLYETTRTHITVTCPTHGDFTQPPDSHLSGHVGCRSCLPTQTSKREEELFQFISELLPQETVLSRRTGILPNPKQELDIYLPHRKIAFEFNGIFWHSEKFKSPNYHYDKWLGAKEEGISLYQIWEDDWVYRQEIVKEHLRQLLNCSSLQKVPARASEIKLISPREARLFHETYHIQGFASASVHVGAYYQGSLVAVASFRKASLDYVLVRYSTSVNFQGGHSKMVTFFERNYTYRSLITFADLTFGEGKLYKSTGWVEDKTISPDYSYLVGDRRKHKFGYRLKRFKSDPDLQYVEGLTERELAKLNNLPRVYDAGKIRFVRPHP